MGDLSWLAHAKILEAGHASDWISGIIGAGGAIVGSLVTVLWTEAFNRRTRQRDLRRKNLVAAYAVYMGLNKIYSISKQVHVHFTGQLKLCGSEGPKCLMVRAARFDRAPVNFSIEDRMGIWSFGGPEDVNKIQSLDASFNFLIECVHQYDQERQRVWDAFQPEEFTGPGAILSAEDRKKFMPKFFELDYMLSQIMPLAGKIAEEAIVCLKLLVYSKGKPLGRKFCVTIKAADGQEMKISALDAPGARRWWQLN
jgi:hypothetical protein